MTTDSFHHIPVMAKEVVAALAPQNQEIYVDATFGGGGYSRKILSSAPCQLYAFDQDLDAIKRGQDLQKEFPEKLHLIHRPFSQMVEALKAENIDSVDGIVFDIGVSSYQIDDPERGFSFLRNGPLDMRMNRAQPESAADFIAHASEDDLVFVFKKYGEERYARRIAKAIVKRRSHAPILTTSELAGTIEQAVPFYRNHDAQHPATRCFQALRIYINRELDELNEALHQAEILLKPGGRLVIVSFHSLEDRIVKKFLTKRSAKGQAVSRHMPGAFAQKALGNAPSFALLHNKALKPSDAEISGNPRARSARLRAATRLDAPAFPREIAEARHA